MVKDLDRRFEIRIRPAKTGKMVFWHLYEKKPQTQWARGVATTPVRAVEDARAALSAL